MMVIFSLIILSFGLTLSALESLFAMEIFSESGLLSGKISKSISHWTTRKKWLTPFYRENAHPFFCSIFLLCSATLLTLSCFKIISPIALFLELGIFLLLFMKSSYGLDGAFHMNLVVLTSLSIGSLFGFDSTIGKFALWFVSGQLILSYFIAGLRKLLSPVWQNGQAITMIFQTEAYGNKLIHKLAQYRWIRLLMSWSVILFETLFPLVLILDYKYTLCFLAIGFVFHLMNAIFMGLNNFLFAFCSAYPILLYALEGQELSIMSLPIIFYLICPILLLAWIWSRSNQNRWAWLFKVTLTGIYLLDLALTGAWPLYGIPFFFKELYLTLFALFSIRSFFRIEKEEKKTEKTPHIFIYVLPILFMGLLSWEAFSAFQGRVPGAKTIALEFPLKKGNYYILNGGSSSAVNGHFPVKGQRYALDIVKLNGAGVRSHKFLPSELKDYCVFSEDLFSPVSGKVIMAENGMKDALGMNIDPIHPAGNHLCIQAEGTNVIVVLAHLLEGSVAVNVGDHVKKGQLLAKVGNTGNTSEPHLHIHAVEMNDRGDFLFEAEPLSILFNDRFLTRNSIYKSQ